MVKISKCKVCGADTYTGGNGKEVHGEYFGTKEDEIEYLLKILYKYMRRTGATPKEAHQQVELSRKNLCL